MEVSFRKAIPADAAMIKMFIVQMSQASDTVYFVPEIQALTTERFAEQLAVIYDSPQHLFLIAATTDCIGLISIQALDTERGEVGIAVAPSFQRMGIGSILLEEALMWFEEESELDQLCLSVVPQNRVAIKLYQNFGFQFDDTIQQHLPQVPYDTLYFMSYTNTRPSD